MVAGPVVLVPLNATAASCSLNVSVNVSTANGILTAAYIGGASSSDWLQYQYEPSNMTFTIAGMPSCMFRTGVKPDVELFDSTILTDTVERAC